MFLEHSVEFDRRQIIFARLVYQEKECKVSEEKKVSAFAVAVAVVDIAVVVVVVVVASAVDSKSKKKINF